MVTAMPIVMTMTPMMAMLMTAIMIRDAPVAYQCITVSTISSSWNTRDARHSYHAECSMIAMTISKYFNCEIVNYYKNDGSNDEKRQLMDNMVKLKSRMLTVDDEAMSREFCCMLSW